MEDKYITYGERSNQFENELYDQEYNFSMANKDEFWKLQAEAVVWHKKPTVILDESHEFMKRWYTDGEINICYNAVDRHVHEGRGDAVAISYCSAYTGEKRNYTYQDLLKEVGQLASVL